MQRQRGNGINQRAVAAYMASTLSDTTGVEYTPAQLKDRISRAFKGDIFTDDTAGLFMTAFDFTREESDELRRAVAELYLLHKTREDANRTFTPSLTDRDYRGLISTFITYIDVNGLIRGFEITETIKSNIDGLQHVTPLFEGADLKFTMDFGGELESYESLGHRQATNHKNNIWETRIKLPKPLAKGEVHQYRYSCALHETLESLEDLKEGDTYYNNTTFGPFDIPHYNLTMILKFDGEAPEITRKMWNDPAHGESLHSEILPTNAKIYSASYPIVYKTAFGYSWRVNAEAVAQQEQQSP